MKSIYLDHAATTPCDPAVIEAMKPYWTDVFANANSPHRAGQAANKALADARFLLASLLGVTDKEIVFTSGATEANNHVIRALVQSFKEPCHIIASHLEHHCIIQPLQYLQAQGLVDITWIHPDGLGVIEPEHIKMAIKPSTKLVIVQHANNQIGTVQSIPMIGKICRDAKVLFLVDAVQTIGHQPVNINDLMCDFVTMSAHKFYGPKGIGALYIRHGVKLDGWILGGDQERSRRAGTVNVPGVVGMAHALKIACERMRDDHMRECKLRDSLISQVIANIDGASLNGHRQQRLANNVNFAFEGIDSEQLLTALDMAGIYASMGSACTSGRLEPSHVLKAIGLSDALALGSLRLTVGRMTTQQDIDDTAKRIIECVHQLRIS